MSMTSRRPRVCVSYVRQALAWSLLLATVPARTSDAQTYTPYSHYQSLSVAEMGGVQVKLTYLGMQNIPVASVAFATAANPMNLTLFQQFRRPGFDYGNDDMAVKSFSVTPQELKTMIDSVASLSEITPGPAEANGQLSFALLDTLTGPPVAFEAIVRVSGARDVIGSILTALAGNGDACRRLREFACSFSALPPNPPSSVEGHASVRFVGPRADHSTKDEFVGRVTIRNTSSTAISSPITLLVIVTGSAQLLGADGASCNLLPIGQPYVVISSPVSLTAGSSLTRTLRFSNPALEKFNVSFRVFSGPGTP